MEYKKVSESNIPCIEYKSKWDCLCDHSDSSQKYLKSFKFPKNIYDNQFTFIFKIKNDRNNFIVVNCFSTSFLVEKVLFFDDFRDEKESLLEGISKSSHNLKKALKVLEKYQNNRLELTESKFWYLVKLLKKSYKKSEQLKSFDYAHINKYLKLLQENKNIHYYFYVEKEKAL